MRRISKNRAAMLVSYKKAKKELETELKARGEWVCLFSGLPLPEHISWKDVSWHHIYGRDGDMLVEKDFLRPVIDRYHTGDEGYHNKPKSYLAGLWWWSGYLDRIKKINPKLYEEENLIRDINTKNT